MAAAAALIGLAPAGVAGAHGDDPRIEVDTQRLAPGAPLTVRGYGFAYESDVELTLVGDGHRRPLALVTADVEGGFVYPTAIPVDVPAGAFVVEAVSGEHRVQGPPMAVNGFPVLPDQGERLEDEDSLLAPMPQAAAPSAQVAPAAAATAKVPVTRDDGGPGLPAVVVGAAAAVAVTAGAIMLYARRRKAPRAT